MSVLNLIPIGEIAKIKGGKRLPKGAELLDDVTEHYYIRVTDMHSDGINLAKLKYISSETHDSISNYIIRENDVYVSIAGTIGRVGVISSLLDKANLTENAAKITNVREDFNPRFIMYFLRTVAGQAQMKAKAGGAAQPKLALYRLAEIEIPQLDISVQNAIVDKIDNYNNLVEINDHQIRLLEKSAYLIYQEWFIHLRFPKHDLLDRVDGLPLGWTKEPLGNLLTLQRGFDLPVPKRLDGNIPIYASTGINGYHNEAKVKGPGVVTGRSGSLGTVMYVANDHWPLNTSLWVKEFKKVSPIFATFLLRSMKLENYNGGAAVPTLNRNDVHKVDVLCPDKSLIDDFDNQVEPIFQQIEKLIEYNAKLAQARDLLLPKLMSGEITV